MRVLRLDPAASLAAARATLVASLPTLDPAGAQPRTRRDLRGARGPVLPPRVRRPGSPGEPQHDQVPEDAASRLQKVLDATAGLDARVVVTTGPVIDPASLRAAANHELHRFVPHAELMPSMSLVVGHGGHSTTMQALAHDLPLVVMPMHPLLDQRMVGQSLERAGAGRLVSKKTSVEDLRTVVGRPARRRAAPGGRGSPRGSDPRHARRHQRRRPDRGPAQKRSRGARSPRGSTVSSSMPSQPASRTSSADSSSAVSTGARTCCWARRTPPSRRGARTAGRP